LVTGCAGPKIKVDSDIPGARVILDNTPTGIFTPGELRVGDFSVGRHILTVQKDGFETVTPPLHFVVRRIVGLGIFATILAPAYGIYLLFTTGWKMPDRDVLKNNHIFHLEETNDSKEKK